MSETTKENLSALMDGELEQNADITIDALLKSSSLKSNWGNYHLIGDSLRQNLPPTLDSGLAQRISDEVKHEPTVLAPATSANRYLKPVAGFAIAASVAVMAIIGIQQNGPAGVQPGQGDLAFNSDRGQTLISAQTVSSKLSDAQLQQARANARARLNSYLVNYNEYRANAGLQGMLPYARTVTFENKE